MESVECDGFKFIFMGSSEHYRDVNKISNYKDFAIRLDQIRRVVGFEGWFINFEISLPWVCKHLFNLLHAINLLVFIILSFYI